MPTPKDSAPRVRPAVRIFMALASLKSTDLTRRWRRCALTRREAGSPGPHLDVRAVSECGVRLRNLGGFSRIVTFQKEESRDRSRVCDGGAVRSAVLTFRRQDPGIG